MIGYILFIISSVLKWVLTPILYTYSLVSALCKREGNEWHTQLATSKDCYGNVLGSYLMNTLLIKSNGYKFGKRKETISSVLGKNERDNTLLSPLGKFFTGTLNLIEKDHCKISIDEEV